MVKLTSKLSKWKDMDKQLFALDFRTYGSYILKYILLTSIGSLY